MIHANTTFVSTYVLLWLASIDHLFCPYDVVVFRFVPSCVERNARPAPRLCDSYRQGAFFFTFFLLHLTQYSCPTSRPLPVVAPSRGYGGRSSSPTTTARALIFIAGAILHFIPSWTRVEFCKLALALSAFVSSRFITRKKIRLGLGSKARPSRSSSRGLTTVTGGHSK